MCFTYKQKIMKNTIEETFGNNYESAKIKRILIPLFTQENNSLQAGIKYFFPENPEIDRKRIVGIEANIRRNVGIAGDILDGITNIVLQGQADSLYLVFYNENNEELFYNIPLRSLFTIDPASSDPVKLQKRIKPFNAKIKTRSCYAYWPANAPAPAVQNIYISLSIYYN